MVRLSTRDLPLELGCIAIAGIAGVLVPSYLGEVTRILFGTLVGLAAGLVGLRLIGPKISDKKEEPSPIQPP
jgi:hypothetical protein